MPTDRDVLRDLATRYLERCAQSDQDEKRNRWRHHNSCGSVATPPIYVRAFAWREIARLYPCVCEDPVLRGVEAQLRQSLYRGTLGDDFVFTPWVSVRAAIVTPRHGLWGLPVPWTRPRGESKTAGAWDPPIKSWDDLERLANPEHRVDETRTADRADKVRNALGDLIPVVVDRAPAYRIWGGDISTHLAYLRGPEQIMWDMMDSPRELHRLLSHMRDGILTAQTQAEQAGHWTLASHENQAMPYAEELDDPSPDPTPVSRRDLWCFCASQETTGVGPLQFEEFMYRYQIPIMQPFGLVAYGCCEDLTHKIDVLRALPNLRRIAVTPFADVAKCVEQIGTDYIISYRPNPSSMVSSGFSDEVVADLLRQDLEILRGTHFDVTLKDVETVQHDPDRCRRWAALARRVCDEIPG